MTVKTPPMGWNSWNTFGENINEQLIMEIADAMVSTGLKDAGYEYVVIDDCWSAKSRDENGDLVADPVKFPHGLKYLADYIPARDTPEALIMSFRMRSFLPETRSTSLNMTGAHTPVLCRAGLSITESEWR